MDTIQFGSNDKLTLVSPNGKVWSIENKGKNLLVQKRLLNNTDPDAVEEISLTTRNTEAALAKAKKMIQAHISKGYTEQSQKKQDKAPTLPNDIEEVASDQTSIITEIIDLTDEELPQKRPRESIQDMLKDVGLQRYVHNFQENGIDSEAFCKLTDSSLHQLGIPKRAREKILSSTQGDDWDPILTQSLVLPYEEEEKHRKSKKFGGSPLPKNFTSEKGRGPPPDFIQVMLAHKWEEEDPTGWWLSEKVDGVRCYWNGKTFQSRNGNKFFAPKFFTENLPKTVSLDGELWMGRKMFQETISIVKRQDTQKYDMNEWAKLIYLVFDAPSIKGPFENRLEYMKHMCEYIQSPYVRAHDHSVCTGTQQLDEQLKRVEELGGEGLMLRKPNSAYENRRSRSLLKVKTFEDAEATVLKIQKGTGRCANMMGAMRVRTDDGREFKIGTGFNDEQRQHPPRIGARVTYKFQELTKNGTPRFPVFMRVHPGV